MRLGLLSATIQSGAAGRGSSGNREILLKLEFNISKNVAHRQLTICVAATRAYSPPETVHHRRNSKVNI